MSRKRRFWQLAPLPQQLTYLRRWWMVLGGIVLLGWVDIRLKYYLHQISFNGLIKVYGPYLKTAILHVVIYLLLLAISYTEKRTLWLLAVGIISYKLYNLLYFHFTVDWYSLSYDYYPEFTRIFHHQIILRILGEFLSGSNPVSVALLSGAYAYWLIGCIRMIRYLAPASADLFRSQPENTMSN